MPPPQHKTDIYLLLYIYVHLLFHIPFQEMCKLSFHKYMRDMYRLWQLMFFMHHLTELFRSFWQKNFCPTSVESFSCLFLLETQETLAHAKNIYFTSPSCLDECFVFLTDLLEKSLEKSNNNNITDSFVVSYTSCYYYNFPDDARCCIFI